LEAVIHLLGQARRALRMTQQQFATHINSSKRTVQRWEAGHSTPDAVELRRIADAVRPHDADLAAHVEAWAPTPPATPAIPATPPPVVSAPPPAPVVYAPQAPLVPTSVLVNAVVGATVEASGLKPSEVRTLLLAAFREAARANVDPVDVVEELERRMGRTEET
jgi:DNA-binding XRE family transcriptional regulator